MSRHATSVFRILGSIALPLLLWAPGASALLATWTNGNGSNLWSDAGNWYSGVTPSAGDIAFFDSTISAPCTIDVNPGAVSIQMLAGYAGTLTQNVTLSAASLSLASGTYVQGTYPLTLSGNLTVSGGSFEGGSNSITALNFAQSGGSFTSTSGAMILTAAAYGSPFQITAGTFSHHNGTIRMTNAGGHVRAGGNPLNHLTCDGDDAQLDAPLTLAGNLTSKSFICWGYALAVAGNVSLPNWFYADTTTFNGSGAQTLDAPSVYSGPIIVAKPGGTLSIVNHNLSLSSGVSLILAQGNLDFGGRTVTVSGNFTNCGGTLNLNNGVLNVAGSFTNTGTAAVGSGTVNLTGASQTILGTTLFPNLTKSVSSPATLTFPAGLTQTVTGALTLQGASGNLLSLRSTAAGTQWAINPQGARSIHYLDVRDSANINAVHIVAFGTGSTDSGNNTNWLFVAPTPTCTVTTTSTPTPTWTATLTATPSATPSATPTATPSGTHTWTATVSPTDTLTGTSTSTSTPSFTITPSASGSPTISFTVTTTATATPTSSLSASLTRTVTPTFTASQTPRFTDTCTATPSATWSRTFALSGLGRSVLGPVPVKAGRPLHLYFDQVPSASACEVYNLIGERLLEIEFADLHAPDVDTRSLAPGIYFVRIKVLYPDGNTRTFKQKIAIVR